MLISFESQKIVERKDIIEKIMWIKTSGVTSDAF
jgi:hypothetical protein